MSRYEVRWWSDSKREDVDIETMHTAYLLNAYRKADRILAEPDTVDAEHWRALRDAMRAELDVRGVSLEAPPEGA